MLTTDYISQLNEFKNVRIFSSTTSFEGSILELYKDFARFGIDAFMESLQDLGVYYNLFYLNLIFSVWRSNFTLEKPGIRSAFDEYLEAYNEAAQIEIMKENLSFDQKFRIYQFIYGDMFFRWGS